MLISISEMLYYLANKILANNLESISYGRIFVCFSAIETFGALMLLGTDVIITKDVSHFYTTNWRLASFILIQTRRFLTVIHKPVVLVTLLIAGVSLYWHNELISSMPFIFILFLFPSYSWFSLYQVITRSLGRYILCSLMEVGQKAIFLIFSFIIAFAAIKFNPLGLIFFASFSMAASYVCISIMIKSYLLYRLKKRKLFFHFIADYSMNFKNILPSYTFQKLGIYAFNTVPILVFETFSRNEHDVGLLATIIVISSLAIIPLKAVAIIIGPEIAIALRSDIKTMRLIFFRIRLLNIVVSCCSIFCIAILAKYLLASFNSHYIESYYLYLWLIGILGYGFTAGTNKIIQFSVNGKTYGNIIGITVLLCQVIFGAVFSYYFALKGIVYTNLLTNVVYVILMLIFAQMAIKAQLKHNLGAPHDL